MPQIKAVIFDYGRTLHNHDADEFFHDTHEVVAYCSGKYKLAIVSITWPQTMEKRWQQIRDADLAKHFAYIELVPVAEEKDRAFERAIQQFGVPYSAVAIVDDRTVRGIKWGNQHGCMTVWLRKGRFADEPPSAATGSPTHTIEELSELMNIL